MVLNHGSIAKTLGGKGILRKKCIFLPQKWPKWPKMAKKIPWGWVSPQNGHFWDSLFSSLFFSDRSKWDFWGSRKRPKMSHHAMHVVPCNFLNSMSYNAMQCYATPYHPMSCHAMKCNDKQCHATPYHARLCNATPHKAITCWGIKWKVWSDGIVI